MATTSRVIFKRLRFGGGGSGDRFNSGEFCMTGLSENVDV
jgi:hypothetical protein